ncbi:hypothetical protein [Fimbriiglobus ruber]|uniref:Zinc-finger domain-containing protein n=1 Tax=Fimbriiglobus ruber TaxID=1908690 RepID=A0A225EDK9_9BACT|nr:hypothetical protein [Fimbriiglobus ruber]OWK46417.1 hypothetical protein FRUB_00116 [Fimbriiglobus ruber]
MICEQARDWLLRADDPHPDRCPVRVVRAHLQSCGACRQYALDLIRVEGVVRAVPTPAAAHRSQTAFLARLNPTVPVPNPKPMPRRSRAGSWRWVVAASLFVGVATLTFFLTPTRQAHADSEIVEQLVEWNIRLSESKTPAERDRLYQEQSASLRERVQTAKLPERDQALAQQLLDHGAWLTEHDDPLDEAEHFQELADTVLDHLETTAGSSSSGPASETYARLHNKITTHGVNANMTKAERQAQQDEKKKQRLSLIEKRQKKQAEKIAVLAEKLTEAAKKHVKPGRAKHANKAAN